MNIHKYYGVSAHNPKFIVRNAIEKDALIVCEDYVLAKEIEDVARGINIPRPLSFKDIIQRFDPHVKNVIFIPTKKQIETNIDPDFSAAEVGDLVWNDGYGLGMVSQKKTSHDVSLFIAFSEHYMGCTNTGRLYKNSPKPTFFYSDGKGNNYLTTRPKQEIDFSMLKEGTRLKTAGGSLVYFVAYMPVSHQPICVASHKHIDGVYSNTRFLPKSAIVRVEAE